MKKTELFNLKIKIVYSFFLLAHYIYKNNLMSLNYVSNQVILNKIIIIDLILTLCLHYCVLVCQAK